MASQKCSEGTEGTATAMVQNGVAEDKTAHEKTCGVTDGPAILLRAKISYKQCSRAGLCVQCPKE